MRVTLKDIEESRNTQMIAKAKENDTLQNSINEIRQRSRQVNSYLEYLFSRYYIIITNWNKPSIVFLGHPRMVVLSGH